MDIAMKYAYLEANQADGTRVLVDLLWPRDVSKEGARIDLWPKEISPSTEQRKWCHQNLSNIGMSFSSLIQLN